MSKATVLIVEDEPIIRMNAMSMLEDVDFAVIEACNADEAIAALESDDTIQAVFTDITMPGSMDGWSLAHTICERWPLCRSSLICRAPGAL
jgi:two-component system, response regulator PdtaR